MTAGGLASIGSRALAWTVDAVLIGLMRGLIQLLQIPDIPINTGSLVTEGIITIALMFLYLCVLPIFMDGRTVGKAALGIRIVTVTGKPLTLWTLFIRNWAGYIVSGLFLGIGYLWALNNEQRQTWHDLAANTLVIKD
jgi:uncharacterized RDD family membrane protein YckC